MTLGGFESASTRNCHAEVFMQRTVFIAVSATVIVCLLLVAITFDCGFRDSEIRRCHLMRLALSWERCTVLICSWKRADRRCYCGVQSQCCDTVGSSMLRFCIVKGKGACTHTGFLPELDPAPVVEFFTRTGITAAGGSLILNAAQRRCLCIDRLRYLKHRQVQKRVQVATQLQWNW